MNKEFEKRERPMLEHGVAQRRDFWTIWNRLWRSGISRYEITSGIKNTKPKDVMPVEATRIHRNKYPQGPQIQQVNRFVPRRQT